MLLGELREKLVVTEDHKSIYVDFRVFGDRQSVAMDLYLNEVLEIARMNPIGTGKTLVLNDHFRKVDEVSRCALPHELSSCHPSYGPRR